MIFNNKIEQNDTISIVYSNYINWDFFRNKTILITGATGLIGKRIVYSILYANENLDTNIKILALIRNKKKAEDVFNVNKTRNLVYIKQDILQPVKIKEKVDFIIHTANSTSSKSFVENPVETIDSIVNGTKNILEFAKSANVKSLVYLSSMEVYGDIPLSKEKPLSEKDYGYIDILNSRSSYPEGKRTAEALCSAYANEYKVPVKIARLAQTIGAGVDYNDGRVFAEFARCVAEKRDIVLKTKGETVRSYIYVTDAVTGILSMLEKGQNGESYNLANPKTTCSIKEMAEMLSKKYNDTKLIFDIDTGNKTYYLQTLKYFLDTEKYESLSEWKAVVSLEEAYSNLINSFIQIKSNEAAGIRQYRLNFLQKLFSITNDNNGSKIITLLGCKIKFNLSLINHIELAIYQAVKGIDNRKIVFSNYMGNGYGCNPKYISEEIIKRRLPYKLVWLVRNEVDKTIFPGEVKLVKYNSKDALKELVTAKVWCDNYHKVWHIQKGLLKNDKQKYIQTWHGSLGIKKIERSVSLLSNQKQWLKNAIYNSQVTDYWISNSEFETDVYKSSFWDVKDVKLFGHPRNDIFFQDNAKIIDKVKKYYNIPDDVKVAFYAPSFRENESTKYYELNYQGVIDSLKRKNGSDWVFLVRLHPRMVNLTKYIIKDTENVINATFYPDIQELLVASDMMITDYSSCIFDFMLTRRPGFIFATDIDEYNTERGFYYPLESTPFPVARNNEELCQNIINFDNEKYKVEVEQFLKEKGCVEDGHASERVVDLIEEVINV